MSTELKPCPFCGNTASFDRVGNRQQSTIVSCDDCGCSLENGEEWNHGKGWNKRPAEDALAARIAELEELDKQSQSFLEAERALVSKQDARIAEQEKRIEALKAALAPFAEAVERLDQNADDIGFARSFDEYEKHWIFTFGQLRAVRAALTEGEGA